MGVFDWLRGGQFLYYPGCLTKNELKEILSNYKEIFDRLGISYFLLSEEESCCGIKEFELGDKKEARVLAKKNFDLFKEKKVSKIITNSPECYHMFKNIYPKLVRDFDIEVEHSSITILDSLKKRGIVFGREEMEMVTFHDSSYLARWCSITEEPRDVIKRLGGHIIEMKNNRNDSLSCGAGGGAYENFPEISKGAAKIVSSKVPKKATKIICVSPLCYLNLKSVDDRAREFSSFVLGRLRGMGI